MTIKDGKTELFGATAALVSMHQKAPLVAPAFAKGLGMQVVAIEDINTDQFGSFSREVERQGTALDAARAKARAARLLHRHRFIIASEGSFGPHPYAPFLAVGKEWLLFWDTENQWESWEQETTTETNYASSNVTSVNEALDFADRIGFPTHALLVRSESGIVLGKGIQDKDRLRNILANELRASKVVRLETDMRAHMNPTRQRSIERVAERLVNRLKCVCPQCSTPGFGITAVVEGLPCEACEAATRQARAYVWSCSKCGFGDERAVMDPSHASAGLCDRCNP